MYSRKVARPVPQHGLGVIIVLLLLFFCVLPSGGQAAPANATGTAQTDQSADASASAQSEEAKEAGLNRIWTSRSDDLVNLLEESRSLQAKAEQLSGPLQTSLQNARAQFTRLKGLFQASRGHPTEQLTLVEQMHSTLTELTSNINPLEQIAETINSRLQEVEALQKDLGNYGSDGVAPLGDTDQQALQTYTQTLGTAGKTLRTVSVRVDKIISPAKVLRDRITQEVSETDNNMVGIWEGYYLTPSANTLEALASVPQMLAEWLTSFIPRMSFAYPQTLDEWADATKNFLIAAIIMTILGALGLRGAASLPEHWRTACESVIKKAWVFIGIGLAVLAASNNHYGGIYFAFVLFGGLIVIWGIAAMSWRLRIVVQPTLENRASPLGKLFIPSAVGVFMLFSDLPTRILGIMWGLFLVVFVIYTIRANRKTKAEGSLPMLESISYNCIVLFGLASLLITLFGQARLAILVFVLLFALVNIVTLATCLMGLLELLANRLFSKETEPVRNALAQAVAVPVAWLLSLICALPWILAVPGARYLVQHVMSANYQVGEAHFDFSKLFAIVLLFFLFRSFISLGKTSLEHLPDRMPNIERGVLPPLSNLVTYGLWALFAIIGLGILGVNFTSLAVVAGGLSVGIGFGMQNIFNNLISGLMLIFGRTLLVGDYIEVGGVAGTVRGVSIRSTTLETAERALIYVPNSSLMAGQFTNWTRNSRMVRRSIVIGVAYGSNTDQVVKILLDTAKANDHVLMYPEPVALFTNFGDNALEFTLNVFIDDFSNAVSTLSDLRLELARKFDEAAIDIPFPQLTLHVPGGEAPALPPLSPSSPDQQSGQAQQVPQTQQAREAEKPAEAVATETPKEKSENESAKTI